MANLTANALITLSAPPTKASPVDIKVWAKWLNNFQTKGEPELEAMVRTCAEFARAFKRSERPRWITLLGETGIGKTHCGRRLWTHLKNRTDWTQREYLPEIIYWGRFVSELRSGNAYDKLRDMASWPVLFLDDIGMERDASGFASEQLDMLLGCREGNWTILTSNRLLDQLGKIDPRIADRIIRKPNLFLELAVKSHSLP